MTDNIIHFPDFGVGRQPLPEEIEKTPDRIYEIIDRLKEMAGENPVMGIGVSMCHVDGSSTTAYFCEADFVHLLGCVALLSARLSAAAASGDD